MYACTYMCRTSLNSLEMFVSIVSILPRMSAMRYTTAVSSTSSLPLSGEASCASSWIASLGG